MGLFDKKYCDICGDKIKLLGNRKLSDGNCCKACASKLSPWFSERKQSTVEEIKEQLAYREANKEEVAAFHTTLTYGAASSKLYLDEDAKKFLITSAKNFQDANPDVVKFSDITGCRVDISHSRSEITVDGPEHTTIHYSPAQYEDSYNFHVVISVNNPYFNEMRFPLNSSEVTITPEIRTATSGMPRPIHPPKDGEKPEFPPIRVTSSNTPDPMSVTEYARYADMGEEIKAALLETRAQARAGAAPKTAKICPCCGASTIPDDNGCCEYCGGAVG